MKNKYTQYFWSFVIVLASVRGAFVYHLGLPSNMAYIVTGVLLVCFGLLSFPTMWVTKTDQALVLLKKAIKVNALLTGFYTLVSMVAISLDQYAMAYSFAIFPIIFTLVRYDVRLLNGIVYAITLVTVVGVFYFYNMGISGGFDEIQDAHAKLRDEFDYSRIGENLLPAGYQGKHHDAANILVMCGVFFLSKSMLSKGMIRYFTLAIYCLILYSALLTGSASNTVVMLAVSAFCLLLFVKKNPYFIAFTAFCVLLFLPTLVDFLADKTYFYEKASYDQSELEGGGIFNALDINSILASFHTILFGFGYVLEVPMIYSEISFVKGLVAIGLIPFLVFMFICFSPLYYIHKFRKKGKAQARVLRHHDPGISTANFIKTSRAYQLRLIIIAMPAFAGTMTMLHYGSLFRITSVGLFCVLLALFYKEYLAINKVSEMQLTAHKLNTPTPCE